MDHECGSCGDAGCTGLCRAALRPVSDALVVTVARYGSPAAHKELLRLAVDRDRQRAALRDIASTFGEAGDHMRRRARAALGDDGA